MCVHVGGAFAVVVPQTGFDMVTVFRGRRDENGRIRVMVGANRAGYWYVYPSEVGTDGSVILIRGLLHFQHVDFRIVYISDS